MISIILGIIAAAMIAAAVVGCFKPGEKDGICNYNNIEE